MDFMEQMEIWSQNNEQQRIIDAIEALPEEDRTPRLISLLARAYNNLAEAGDAPLFRKAIALLESVADELRDDYAWNFRMAYAYYYLDQEGPALRYFENALELKPEDEDTREFIDDCRDRLALPLFEKPFRERAAEGWASFLAGEAQLRAMIAEKQDGELLIRQCAELLSPAFDDIAFELGVSGEKYELILTPEGNRAKLFQLACFQRLAPAELLSRWTVLVGRQPAPGFALRMFDQEISAGSVLVWVREAGEESVALSLYCEKLLPLLREDEGHACWIISILLDQALGELSAMKLVDDFELLEAPLEGESCSLDRLPELLQKQGLTLADGPEAVLERYSAYRMEPDLDEAADLRLDVVAGMTLCPPLINEYLQDESGLMDSFHRDGAVPGFLYYPLDSFAGAEERGKQVLDFRDSLEAAILEQAGWEAVTFIGGASGVHYGYLDFIAWDLRAVLDAADHFFEKSPMEWAAFHTFRRDVGGVSLKKAPERESGADGAVPAP